MMESEGILNRKGAVDRLRCVMVIARSRVAQPDEIFAIMAELASISAAQLIDQIKNIRGTAVKQHLGLNTATMPLMTFETLYDESF